MNQEHDRKPPAGANWIWVMGGCYLLYLAASMLMRVYNGHHGDGGDEHRRCGGVHRLRHRHDLAGVAQ